MRYRDTSAFAYAQGFYEMLTNQFGRTHTKLWAWNEWYDRGGTHAERILNLFGVQRQ